LTGFPHLGHGVGLRPPHYAEILETQPHVEWFEVISENFFEPGGNPRRVLHAVRERWPVVLHGVSMSLGSVDPLNEQYLKKLKALEQEIEPAWVSDHLCWGSFGGRYAHDLLPLPYTEEAVEHFASRVRQVQDFLGRQLVIENVSSYLTYRHSTMSEWEFLSELCRRADCFLLLDVNNVFVSAHNHGFDPLAFLGGVPKDRVKQLHLAGHSQDGEMLLDTHDHPVPDGVWALYRATVERLGPVSTLVEWDESIPPLQRLLDESRRAAQLEAEVVDAHAA
jgi:uncharacterized protein (UPF0276 family)